MINTWCGVISVHLPCTSGARRQREIPGGLFLVATKLLAVDTNVFSAASTTQRDGVDHGLNRKAEVEVRDYTVFKAIRTCETMKNSSAI
jgi:hypothetical protein